MRQWYKVDLLIVDTIIEEQYYAVTRVESTVEYRYVSNIYIEVSSSIFLY